MPFSSPLFNSLHFFPPPPGHPHPHTLKEGWCASSFLMFKFEQCMGVTHSHVIFCYEIEVYKVSVSVSCCFSLPPSH